MTVRRDQDRARARAPAAGTPASPRDTRSPAVPATGSGVRAPAVRRLAWAAGTALTAAVLFVCYLWQSRTLPVGSDGGSIALQAWDMLHGNVLLHGWTVSDVSFYPTELVQYAVIEAIRGLSPDVVHIAGAMTYTLIILLAGYLARGRATGREGLIRLLVAAVVMLAPAPGASPTLLLSPDHFGSAVPVLLAWLAVERLPSRWYRPASVAILLAWGQAADSLILVTGAAPMAAACAVRACVKLRRREPGSRLPWTEVSLAAAAIVSAGLARAAEAVIRLSGGFGLQPVATTLAPLSALPHHLALTAEGLLGIFGASFSGPQSGADLVFAALHVITVAAVAVAFVLAVGRLGRNGDLVVPGLALAIIFNIAAYVPTPFVQNLLSTRDISAVLPFAAVLAGRLLASPLTSTLNWARLTPVLALAVAFAAALGYHAAQPAQPAQNQSLATWLAARHLSAGLATNYWVANSTTLDSGGRITVRQIALSNGTLARPVPRELKSGWYDPASQYADFIVAGHGDPGGWAAEWRAAVATFGRPAQILYPSGYTVLVWDKNLLAGIR